MKSKKARKKIKDCPVFGGKPSAFNCAYCYVDQVQKACPVRNKKEESK